MSTVPSAAHSQPKPNLSIRGYNTINMGAIFHPHLHFLHPSPSTFMFIIHTQEKKRAENFLKLSFFLEPSRALMIRKLQNYFFFTLTTYTLSSLFFLSIFNQGLNQTFRNGGACSHSISDIDSSTIISWGGGLKEAELPAGFSSPPPTSSASSSLSESWFYWCLYIERTFCTLNFIFVYLLIIMKLSLL